MSKKLEALKRIRRHLTDYKDSDDSPYLSPQDENDLNIIEKSLKALEIIKEKGLSINDIAFIKNGISWETYVETMKELYWGDERLNKILKAQEEYELLKEVLL